MSRPVEFTCYLAGGRKGFNQGSDKIGLTFEILDGSMEIKVGGWCRMSRK